MFKSFITCLVILISFNSFASENLYGTYNGVKYSIYVGDDNIWGRQGDQRFSYYINDDDMWGTHLSGKRVSLYANKENLWGNVLCGDVSIYFYENLSNMWGKDCEGRFSTYLNDRSQVRAKINLMISKGILSGFILPIRQEIRKKLRMQWADFFSSL